MNRKTILEREEVKRIRRKNHEKIIKMIKLLLLFSFLCLSGCRNSDKEIVPTPQPELTQPLPTATAPAGKEEGFLAMTEEEICSEAYALLQLAQTEWNSFLLKRTEKEAFLLIAPGSVKVDKAGYVANISVERNPDWGWYYVYLLVMEQRDGELHKTALTEYGVSQIGIYSVGKETFAGIVYLEHFADWEEYGMKWYCFDGTGNVIRIYGNAEKENVYTYWQNHKPVLLADGAMELYRRTQETGSFEALVQETEQENLWHYTSQWEKEQTLPVSEWLKDYVPREAGDGLSGLEVIREVLRADKEGELPYRIYFNSNYDGAAVMEYIPVGKEIYFAIKRLGFFHSGGYQALFIGSLNEEGRLRQCRYYGGDRSQAAFLQIGTEAYILYCAEEIWTGLPSARGGLLHIKDGALTQKWPVTETGEPDESYWQGRTARIKDGKMEIYAIEYTYFQLDGEPMVSGFERKLEEVKSFD